MRHRCIIYYRTGLPCTRTTLYKGHPCIRTSVYKYSWYREIHCKDLSVYGMSYSGMSGNRGIKHPFELIHVFKESSNCIKDTEKDGCFSDFGTVVTWINCIKWY